MGSNGSKPNTNDTSVIVQTRDPDVIENPDPRSPTPEVTRTPLHNKSGSKHNITKNVDLRKTFESAKEEKLIHNNPILTAVIKNHLQSYDPRSPTQDFERTPIVISKIDELKERKLMHHKKEHCVNTHLNSDHDNCDSCSEANERSPELIMQRNLCERFYDMALNESLKETSGPLGSSTASNEAIENGISNICVEQQPTTLLETNFDYIETDDKFEDSYGNLSSKSENLIEKIPVFEILDDDPRSPSIGIERTPIVIAKIDEDSEDNVEEMSDDSLIKVLQNTNAELRQTKVQCKNTEELLIYEDDATNINDTPKKSKSTSNSGERTPLTCMKNKDAGHTRSKSVNTLYDPKKGSKIPKKVSHIPRLKALSKKTNLIPTGSSVSLKNISKASSIGGDCENTPPHSHRDRWDKDSSIVL